MSTETVTLEQINEKFRQFIETLCKVDVEDTSIHPTVLERVTHALTTVRSGGKFVFEDVAGKVHFDKEDPCKVLSTSLSTWRKYSNLVDAFKEIELLCTNAENCLVPEPEVLRAEEGEQSIHWFVTREWLNWYSNIFPGQRRDHGLMAGIERAKKKQFMVSPTVTIEHCLVPGDTIDSPKGVEVEFWRVTRVKL